MRVCLMFLMFLKPGRSNMLICHVFFIVCSMCLTAGKSNGFIFHVMFQFFETKQIENAIFHKFVLIFQCIFTAGKSNMSAIRVSFKVFDTCDVGNTDFSIRFHSPNGGRSARRGSYFAA